MHQLPGSKSYVATPSPGHGSCGTLPAPRTKWVCGGRPDLSVMPGETGLHWHQTNCPKPTVLAQKHTLGVLSPRLRASPGAVVSRPDVLLTV